MFLYVFNVADRDTLVGLGYTLLKSDERNNMFVFENSDALRFDAGSISAIQSNVLTF